jgi:hypothetical protein
LVPAGPAAATRVTCLATAVLAAELYFTRDTARCRQLSRAAVELARQVDDPGLFATVVALSEMAVWASNGAAQRIALRREAVARGLTPAQEAAALYRNAMDLYQIAEVQAGNETLRRCVQLVAAHHTPGWDVALGHLRASRLVATGDLDGGEQLAVQTSAAQRRTTMGGGDGIVSGLLLSVRLEQGRLVEALPALEQALAGSRLPVLNDAVAFVLAQTGRPDDAEAALAGGEPTSELPDDGLLTGRLAFRAYARYDLSRAGRATASAEAQALCDRLRPSAGQLVMHGGGISVWGAVDLFLAMALLLAGDPHAATEALHQAVKVNDAAANPAWGARARRLLARTVRQQPGAQAFLADRLVQAAAAAIAAAEMPATAGAI